MAQDPAGTEGSSERRRSHRLPTRIDVDYRSDGTYLFAAITDISPTGIFVCTDTPLPQGTRLQLRFSAPDALVGLESADFELEGQVVWVTSGEPGRNGMGVRFHELHASQQTRLFELVRAIAYLDLAGAN